VTRHIRWQILLIVIGAVLVGILLTYLALRYTTIIQPGYGGTYVEGIIGFPRYMNPLLSGYNEVDRDISSLLFSGLTQFTESGEIEANVARSWEISADGLTYTFNLRSDVHWHDGTPLTADDVVFTIKLLQNPNFPAAPDTGQPIWQMVTVNQVDRRTVQFTLGEPFAPFLDYTTVGILPAHLLSGVMAAAVPSAEFNDNPVGSGPYQLEQIEVSDGVITSMVLKRSPNSYRSRPYLDRLQFRFYPSYQGALKAYENDEIEGISRIPISELSQARSYEELNLFSAQLAQFGAVLMNQTRDDLVFFQDPEVRQALLYALDRQGIINEAFDGYALVPHSPMVAGTWAYKEDVFQYGYDPAKAAEILDEAGWVRQAVGERNRRKENVWLTFELLTSSDPQRTAVAQMMAEQWATLGISATVRIGTSLEVRQALETREFDAVLVELAIPGDPDPYPFWHETQVDSGQNYSGLEHRRISEVIEQARIVTSRDTRRALYDEFQDIFAQEVPALLMYVPVYTYGVDSRIHGVQIGPLTYPADRFRTLLNWWIVPRRVFVSESEVSLP